MKAVSQREVLTDAELRSALEGLSQSDLLRIRSKATLLATGTGMEPDDLINEAILRTLEENGGRNCPRDVAPVTFLNNVIRSIASHSRTNWTREMPTGTIDDKDDPILNAPDPTPSPEELVIVRLDSGKALSRFETIFNDDPHAWAVMTGIMEDWSPQEIREVEPMSEREYVAARKRVRRAFLREFPKGTTYE